MSLLTGLMAYHKLEGNSVDSVGAHNGTDTAITYSLANGKIGQGAGFDGTTSKIALPSGWLPTGDNPRSASIWFNTSSANIGTLFGNGSSSENYRTWRMDINTAGSRTLVLGFNGYFAYTSTNAFSNGVWNHCVMTYAGGGTSTANIKMYLNGVPLTISVNGFTTLNVTGNNAAIGWDAAYNNRFFNGKLDELAVYNRVLTPDEAYKLYGGGAGYQWPFPTLSPFPTFFST